ncbi:MAG: hypothetical protein PVH17_10380 [Anaerolineae bacterium]
MGDWRNGFLGSEAGAPGEEVHLPVLDSDMTALQRGVGDIIIGRKREAGRSWVDVEK